MFLLQLNLHVLESPIPTVTTCMHAYMQARGAGQHDYCLPIQSGAQHASTQRHSPTRSKAGTQTFITALVLNRDIPSRWCLALHDPSK